MKFLKLEFFLKDSFNREIDYLRVSVTSRCNFRCLYCMPDTPFEWEPKENLLSYEDMFEFIKIAIDNGIKKIRLTGGEPLLRKDLDKFINMIYSYSPNIDLALTTNGYLLPTYAKRLKQAGLKRVNISLDSLNRETYQKLAQKDVLDNVLKGIEESINEGLKVKLNCVILKNQNENEIIELLKYGIEKNITIRFIEYMENKIAHNSIEGLNSIEILSIISKDFKFQKIKRDNSPAQYYKLENNNYIFGIIEPHKEDFCENCNRIRLTAEGFLIPCLYFDEAMSIKEAIKNREIKKATTIFKEVIINKPEKNRWNEELSDRAFYETGG
jgi:cyclic pyranopterin phosphate synthase